MSWVLAFAGFAALVVLHEAGHTYGLFHVRSGDHAETKAESADGVRCEYDPADVAADLLRDYTLDVALDYAVRVMPTTVFIGADGNLVERKGIYPNLDYPSGPAYNLMGFDTLTFTRPEIFVGNCASKFDEKTGKLTLAKSYDGTAGEDHAGRSVGSAFPPSLRLRRVSPKLEWIGRAAADRT